MVKNKRYLVLVTGMVIQFCAGIIYMWSVFRTPVAEHLHWDMTSASLTSSIMLAAFVIGIMIGGRVQDKIGPRIVAVTGSIMISLGMLLTTLITEAAPWMVYVTYGIIGGLGVGAVYTSTVSVVQKWFPDKRGFASGMIVSAFGFSLVVFSPLAKTMLADLGVPTTFLIFGAAFLVVCVISSLFVVNPPEGFLPEGFVPSKTVSTKKQYSTVEMLKTKQFYMIVFAMLFTLPAYFIINPHLLSLGEARGLSDFAVFGVMLTGIASATGRLVVSWVSDKAGRKPAMFGICLISLASSLALIIAEGVLFLICISLISFSFGGSASVYAAFTADNFGTKHMGMNFGCVMLGFGVSALLFPLISNALVSGENYGPSFIVASITSVVAMIFVAFLKKPNEKE